MADSRIIVCGACGGDCGHHDFAGHWARCDLCLGEGELEVEVSEIEMEDLEEAHG